LTGSREILTENWDSLSPGKNRRILQESVESFKGVELGPEYSKRISSGGDFAPRRSSVSMSNLTPDPSKQCKSKVEIKSEPEVEIKSEPKVEIKSEPKVEIKSEPKVEIKSEPKVEIKSEPKVEIQSDPLLKLEVQSPELEILPSQPLIEAQKI
jgi:hypothetical protein